MRPKSKQQMFANDDAVPEGDAQLTVAAPEQQHQQGAGDPDSAPEDSNIDDASDMEYLRSRMRKFDSGAQPPHHRWSVH